MQNSGDFHANAAKLFQEYGKALQDQVGTTAQNNPTRAWSTPPQPEFGAHPLGASARRHS